MNSDFKKMHQLQVAILLLLSVNIYAQWNWGGNSGADTKQESRGVLQSSSKGIRISKQSIIDWHLTANFRMRIDRDNFV